MRLQSDSQHALSRQREDHAHNQHPLFHELDSAIKDKDATVHTLQRELVNHKKHALSKLEQARVDGGGVANMSRRAFADGPSSEPCATPAKKRTVSAVAAVAHAVPVHAHSPDSCIVTEPFRKVTQQVTPK